MKISELIGLFKEGRTTAKSHMKNLLEMAMIDSHFDDNEYLRVIAEDKKLNPDWVRSLYIRGKKQVYSTPDALKHIGMPVGGLFAGTVYLSGDGRLWLWDIFNRDQEGIPQKPFRIKGRM